MDTMDIAIGQTVFFIRCNSESFWSVKRGEVVSIVHLGRGGYYVTKNGCELPQAKA